MPHRLALAALLLVAAPVRASDGPTVDFALEDGWVNLRLHAGDTPVAEAKLIVFVGDGVWAEGETDAAGKGIFPRPMATTCQVVFQYTTGTSAPVPLTFTGDAVTPTSAPVGGARPPCCPLTLPLSATAAPPTPDPLGRTRMIVFAVALGVLAAVAVVAYRLTMARVSSRP